MKKYQLTLLSLCMAAFAQAKVTLPAFFTDNMVVQQNSILTFPGTAKAGKVVTAKVGWNTEKYTVKAGADGKFSIQVPTPNAGGPYQIVFSDGDQLTLNNVMAGEVWLCSGQSNMEMPLAGWGKVMNYEEEIANANYPSIRLLQVKKAVAFTPQNDGEMNMGGWQECSSATVPEFSSVAYFYARNLSKELNVPIGVIDCTWGGTPAEAWTSYNTLKDVMGFQQRMAQMKDAGFKQANLNKLYDKEMAEWMEQFNARDAGVRGSVPQWVSTLQTGKEWKTMELPSYWESCGLNYDGIVWFQKEVNIPADWAGKAVSLCLAMIDDDDKTYYNGQKIGSTSGCTTMRNYTIPANQVKAGKGLITVRAIDYGGDGGIHGEATDMFIECNGKRISLAGDWIYLPTVSMTNLPQRPVYPGGTGMPSSSFPTVLYNAMVNPLVILPIQGVIWYQGETNVGYDEQYRVLFQSMITDWRKAWNKDFPFYFVQLANYLKPEAVQPDSKWAALRDAQAHALHLPNTAMASAIDIGLANDIHPKNKQEVGRRLAKASLAHTYGIGTYEVPAFLGYRISGNQLIITFDQEVVAKGNTPEGFILAGSDGIFHPAKATIQGKEVILQADAVAIPTAARYAWADNPTCNLYGKSNLPVPPFRTRD